MNIYVFFKVDFGDIRDWFDFYGIVIVGSSIVWVVIFFIVIN